VIVIVGTPHARRTGTGVVAGGVAAGIARAAATAGRVTQLVARISDDPDGDAVLLDLAAAGVGHVATLRQPPGATGGLEAADLALALRYLADIAVIVLSEIEAVDVVAAAVEAAEWSGAALVVVLEHGGAVPGGLPDEATVMGAPAGDPDDAFAVLVGGYVAALDAGMDPSRAFRDTIESTGAWTAVPRTAR
jgi:hypothetical protein